MFRAEFPEPRPSGSSLRQPHRAVPYPPPVTPLLQSSLVPPLVPRQPFPLLHPTADQVPNHSHPVCPLTASRGCTKDRLHPPLRKRLPGYQGCLSREGRVFLSGCTSPKTQAPSRSMVKPPQGCGQPGTRPRPPTRWTQGLDRVVRGLRRRRRVAHS